MSKMLPDAASARLPLPVNTFLKNARLRLRMLDAPKRALPHFIIIGAQRGGTTSLYAYLCQHPDIHAAFVKEVGFFSQFFDRDMRWYRAHFPARKSLAGGAVSGESSPDYIYFPQCAARIAETVPGVKLIALLRNPADRAVSAHALETRRGVEELPLAEAIYREETRLASERAKMESNPIYWSETWRRFSYKQRGLYAEQIERYLRHFHRDELLVLRSEDLFADPAATVKRVFDFVGVDSGFAPPDLRPRNAAPRPVDSDDAVRDYLTEYFKPHNARLEALLNMKFDW